MGRKNYMSESSLWRSFFFCFYRAKQCINPSGSSETHISSPRLHHFSFWFVFSSFSSKVDRCFSFIEWTGVSCWLWLKPFRKTIQHWTTPLKLWVMNMGTQQSIKWSIEIKLIEHWALPRSWQRAEEHHLSELSGGTCQLKLLTVAFCAHFSVTDHYEEPKE